MKNTLTRSRKPGASRFGTNFLLAAFAAMLLVILTSNAFAKAKEQVLYSFSGGADGSLPLGPLVLDKSGNLYGVATSGGATGNGVVFELTSARGTWTQSVLYTFQGGTDGATPQAGVVFDKAGNLYGTTYEGGSTTCNRSGCGTVFELSPGAKGQWTETVLYRFNGGTDGIHPQSNLVLDSKGNLYGTTAGGGDTSCDPAGCGTVFELSQSGGHWTETVLHAFAGGSGDGATPFFAGVIFDTAGNLYGTTLGGGESSTGTVFELSPSQSGQWTATVLHSFAGGRDGRNPGAGLVLLNGSLFGTTYAGGTTCECGTAFELTPQPDSTWKETIIHRFKGPDGIGPTFSLINDTSGNLYGTVFDGGAGACQVCGTAFELSPTTKAWKGKILHHFGAHLSDAGSPNGGLILDNAGNLYGSSELGGTTGNGTVYEITP